MISGPDLARGLFVGWRILRGDTRALALLDNTPETALRSFWAAALCLPPFLLAFTVPRAGTESVGLGRLVTVELLTYAISWTAYPLAALRLAQIVGRAQRFPRYLALYNWMNVYQYLLLVPFTALVAWGGPSQPVRAVVGLAVFAVVAGYAYYVARIALELDSPQAIGFVVVDVAVSLLVQTVAAGIEGR